MTVSPVRTADNEEKVSSAPLFNPQYYPRPYYQKRRESHPNSGTRKRTRKKKKRRSKGVEEKDTAPSRPGRMTRRAVPCKLRGLSPVKSHVTP